MRTFHVIVVNLEHRLHGNAGAIAQENRVHQLARIHLAAVVPNDHLAVVACISVFVENVTHELRAHCAGSVVQNRQALVLRGCTLQNIQTAVIEVCAFAVQFHSGTDAANAAVLQNVREMHRRIRGLLDVEMPKGQRQVVSGVCKKDFELGAFCYIDIETFRANFMHHLVVKDFNACLCVLADVQNGTTEVVVALEHRHFVFAVGNRLHQLAGVAGNRQKGGKVVFVCEVFVASAFTREFRSLNLVDREKRPQFVIATRHSQLFNAGNGVH